MKTLRLTKEDAQEVLHKMTALEETPDLCEDYGITVEDAGNICQSIPKNGGEWTIPSNMETAVKGEIEDHAIVLRDIANDALRSNEWGQFLRINKQAKRLEDMAEAL